jgi:peroxiredoxin
MVEDTSFTAPSVQDGKIEEFEFTGDGKTVIAFFPSAFTETCTNEMNRIQEELDDLRSLGAEVIGVSVDTPFSLKEFAEQNDLDFRLVSDHEKQIIDSYGVSTSFDSIGFRGLAQRALFIVEEGEVTYSESVDPGEMPSVAELRHQLGDST